MIPLLGVAEDKNTKDLIIHILSKQWPLTARKLFFILKNEHSLGITYQAVHKALNQLIGSKVIEKKDKEYRLSIDWLESLKKFVERSEVSYLKDREKLIEYVKKHGFINLYFDTKIALGNFIINEFTRFPNPEKKTSAYRWRHMYCLIGLPNEMVSNLSQLSANQEQYILCNKTDPFDVFLAETFRKMGGKVKIGVTCARTHDTFVHGDFEARVFWSNESMKETDEYHASFKAFNLQDIQKMLYNNKYEIAVTLLYSQYSADRTREQTLKHFTRELMILNAEPTIGLIKKEVKDNKRIFYFKNYESAEKFRKELQLKNAEVKEDEKTHYISHSSHLKSPLFMRGKQMEILSAVINNFKVPCYALVSSNTVIDKWCADYYMKGTNYLVKVITGVKLSENHDLIVLGDIIVKIFIPKEIKQTLDKAYKKAKNPEDIDVDNLYKKVYSKDVVVKMEIEVNKSEAEKITRKTLEIFKKYKFI